MKSSTDISKYRPLGPSENALMIASLKYRGCFKLGEVLHLYGPLISLQTLDQAVSKIQRRYPTLRSRLKQHSSNPDSFILEIDDALKIRIREIHRQRADHSTFYLEEWRKHEYDTMRIGDGIAEVWLLQVK